MLAILGPRMGLISYTTKRLIEEAEKQFSKVEYVPLIEIEMRIGKKMEIIHKKKSLDECGYIFPRIDPKRAVIGHSVMRFLDGMGYDRKPFSSDTVLVSHNKFLTLQALRKNGVRVPKTSLTSSPKVAKEMLKKQKLPFIMKLLSGFGGQGVMFIESKEAAESIIKTMETLKQEIFIEEYVKGKCEDIRGMVVGGEVTASYKRVGKESEKRSNIKSGGKPVQFRLDGEMEEIAIKAAEAIGAKICAIDMLDSREGPMVIETNINPGIGSIEKVTNKNIAQEMIRFAKSEAKE